MIDNIVGSLKINPVDQLQNQLCKPRENKRAHQTNNAAAFCTIVWLFLSSSLVQYKHYHSKPNYIHRRLLCIQPSPPSSTNFSNHHLHFSPLPLATSRQCFPLPICCLQQFLEQLVFWLILFFRQYLSMSFSLPKVSYSCQNQTVDSHSVSKLNIPSISNLSPLFPQKSLHLGQSRCFVFTQSHVERKGTEFLFQVRFYLLPIFNKSLWTSMPSECFLATLSTHTYSLCLQGAN